MSHLEAPLRRVRDPTSELDDISIAEAASITPQPGNDERLES